MACDAGTGRGSSSANPYGCCTHTRTHAEPNSCPADTDANANPGSRRSRTHSDANGNGRRADTDADANRGSRYAYTDSDANPNGGRGDPNSCRCFNIRTVARPGSETRGSLYVL